MDSANGLLQNVRCVLLDFFIFNKIFLKDGTRLCSLSCLCAVIRTGKKIRSVVYRLPYDLCFTKLEAE